IAATASGISLRIAATASELSLRIATAALRARDAERARDGELSHRDRDARIDHPDRLERRDLRRIGEPAHHLVDRREHVWAEQWRHVEWLEIPIRPVR